MTSLSFCRKKHNTSLSDPEHIAPAKQEGSYRDGDDEVRYQQQAWDNPQEPCQSAAKMYLCDGAVVRQCHASYLCL